MFCLFRKRFLKGMNREKKQQETKNIVFFSRFNSIVVIIQDIWNGVWHLISYLKSAFISMAASACQNCDANTG